MTITVCSTDRRDLDALVYFLNHDQWQKRIVLRNGTKVYGLPSRTRQGLYHLTDGSSCTCEDQANINPSGGCAHMRAAVLYRMEKAGEQARSDSQYLSQLTRERAALGRLLRAQGLRPSEDAQYIQYGMVIDRLKVKQPTTTVKPSLYSAFVGDEDDKPYCSDCERHHETGQHYLKVAS